MYDIIYLVGYYVIFRLVRDAYDITQKIVTDMLKNYVMNGELKMLTTS